MPNGALALPNSTWKNHRSVLAVWSCKASGSRMSARLSEFGVPRNVRSARRWSLRKALVPRTIAIGGYKFPNSFLYRSNIMLTTSDAVTLTCPIPINDYPAVLMAHGGGGKLMHHLIEKMIAPAFKNPVLDARHDSAVLGFNHTRLAFTTDSFVVHPLFFPGGDIGQLAVNGTVNDLAMSGARPLYLSASLIIEEGLPMETLWRVVQSMRQAAQAAGVQFVTGDTKVVDKGKGDGLFINTSGIGLLEHD